MSEINKENSYQMPAGFIGTCMICGIAVTEENVGETKPKVICAACKQEREETLLREKEEREKARELERIRLEEAEKREQIRKLELERDSVAAGRKASIIRLCLSNGVALVVAAGLFFLAYGASAPTEIWQNLLACFFIMTYVSTLFYPEALTKTLFLVLAFKGFNLPFIIFDFDLDGCLMAIAIKLIGWLIGLIIGILGFCLAIALGIVISPLVWIYNTIKDILGIVKGDFNE